MSNPHEALKTFTEEVGIEVVSMEAGEATAQLKIVDSHLNSGRIVHGGVLMSLADTVAGAAAFSILDDGQRAVTTDAHVTCLRSVTEGIVIAEAEVVHASRRFIHVRLSESCDGKLVASGVISFMRIEPRA